jgi:uncharacterized protein YcbX
LYPIKSCSAQQVQSWPVGPKGLLFDREWALVDPAGQLLTLKNCPRLTQLQPRVDLEQGVLTVAVAGGAQPPLRLRIPRFSSADVATAAGCKAVQAQEGVARAGVDSCRQQQQQQLQVRVCGDTICSSVLSEVLLPELEDALAPSSAAAADAAGGDDSRDSTCLVTTNRPASPTHSSKAPAHNLTSDSASAATGGAVNATHSKAPARAGAGSLSAVEDWFEAAVGVRCRVVQAAAHARAAKLAPARQMAGDSVADTAAGADVVSGKEADQISKQQQQQQQPQQQLGFANEGQYLLLNLSSLDALLAPQQQQQQQQQESVGRAEAQDPASTAAVTSSTHQSDTSDPASVLRFRPNLVVSGLPPWAEDSWSAVQIGAVQLQSAGACARCDLVTLHPGTGVREGQGVLRALAGSRRHRGKLNFGVLLSNAAGVHSCATGCGIDPADSVQEQQQRLLLQGTHAEGHRCHLPWLRVGDTVQGQL